MEKLLVGLRIDQEKSASSFIKEKGSKKSATEKLKTSEDGKGLKNNCNTIMKPCETDLKNPEKNHENLKMCWLHCTKNLP